MSEQLPVIAFTQGDPAGIGPEILLDLLRHPGTGVDFRPLLVAERAALEALRSTVPDLPWGRLLDVDPAAPDLEAVPADAVAVLDPVAMPRRVTPGLPNAADAHGALAALDTGMRLARHRIADALLTAPLNKATIAEHVDPSFRGHTDYLAEDAGLERYGRDYLMSFLAPSLRVALLSTHVSLSEAIAAIDRHTVLDALRCLARHAGGKIAVAGLNPHAGEGGLMGREEIDHVLPAVRGARAEGIDAHGPESPDSLFARARQGEFDWVLALYHDQGLIAVKTASFGSATNLTLGLPYLRTSVDHGTAYGIAGRGESDVRPLRAVIETTLALLAEAAERPEGGGSAAARGSLRQLRDTHSVV